MAKTLEVQGQLAESFLNIENDNYSTQGAETPDKIKSLLEGYYSTEVIPVLENRTDRKVPLSSVLPADNKQIISAVSVPCCQCKAIWFKTQHKQSAGW